MITVRSINDKVQALWEEACAIAQKITSPSGKRKKATSGKKVPLKDRLDNLFDVASCK